MGPVEVQSSLTLETTCGTSRRSQNCEVVLISVLKVYISSSKVQDFLVLGNSGPTTEVVPLLRWSHY